MAKAKKQVKEVKNKKPTAEEVIKIPRADIKQARITIVGTSPLMVNRFDEKSRQQIEDSYRGAAKNKSAPRSVEDEFKASLYPMPGKKGVYGVPAAGIKNCAVSACRFVEGINMTTARGAFHVIEDAGGLVTIKSKTGPTIDERVVRVGTFGNKKPATRRRGRFDQWELTFTVCYNAGVINLEQLLNLYENAGFSIGLCEFRPEKSGNMGMFTVKRS